MASTLPPVKNASFTFDISLVSQADTDIFKTSVTLAAGDVTVHKDGGAAANITSLPTEIGTTGVLAVALSADEMNADRVTVRFHDVAGNEWQDALVTIYTAAQTLDATDAVADTISGIVGHADYGNAKLARTGADSDTLETLSDQLDTAQADLDNPSQYKADVSGLATSAALATAQADLDNPNQYKADVSGLATSVAVAALPTAAQTADAVWDEASADHVVAGSTGAALSAAGGSGAGAIEWTYTLTSSVDGSPIADADIWVTTDLAGSNVIASGQTDAYGQVTLHLDAGTIYVWRQKSGWDFTNPDTETVA